MSGLNQLEVLWADVAGVENWNTFAADHFPTRQAIYSLLSTCIDVESSIDKMKESGGNGTVDWIQAVALFPMEVRNNPALKPIVDFIERMVQEELQLRERALEEINLLEAELEGISSELTDSEHQGTRDKRMPLFESLRQVRRRYLLSQNLVSERRRKLDDLKSESKRLKEELSDLMPFEFEVYTKNLSTKAIKEHEENLRHLRSERDRRLGSLATLHTDLLLIYSQIGFASQTTHDHELSDFLRESASKQVKEGDDVLTLEFSSIRSYFLDLISHRSASSNSLSSSISSSVSETSSISTLIASIPALPWYLRLSRSCIAELEERRDIGRNRLSALVKATRMLVKEIGLFWQQLDVPLSEQFTLKMDVRRLEEFQIVADKLRIGWKKLMGGELIETMEKMQGMWRKCHISKEEQEETKKEFPPNFFSPLTIEFIRNEIVVLEERYDREKHLIALIEQRNLYIEKLKEFEKDASDPNRLFKASFRLLEEEKFRKTAVPTLMKMEANLKNLVRDFEGKRWLQTLV
ncbi:hypothetical protein HDU97_000985 [Phlyctochytrium planicorne]|nr:hypothetical protein HDU97_000985 [Phlyctochytrium planicorne]